ncbi:hypothetical protein [Kutzneria buriramensis]|uniref:hypothetical protein n=1 Tax=Kutzneria buriramensis TaxID=1045776 RepID=UPI0011C0D3D8|nr:hypothetical protein [Kutzneria buriramensis]
MDLEDTANLTRVRFPIRDRDTKYPKLIDKILSDARISSVLTGVRDAPHERDRRTLGQGAARGTAGPHADLEPDPADARYSVVGVDQG